ncbi:MAG: hypothetical protein V7637_3880 [Mycobacteriales bacterium]
MTALRRAVVTGATGLLGSNLVRHLLADNTEVVAIVRDRARAERLLPDSIGLQVVRGDITRPETIAPALRGADAIFHTAAYFREYYGPRADLGLLHRTNVTAVINLLGAAVAAGVPVIVHTSSAGVLGPARHGQAADESTPLPADQGRNRYFASKARAEQEVGAFARRHGLRVPIVLPGWMWGPGDAGPTSSGALFLRIAQGRQAAVPATGNYVVDARDVAAACVRAAAGRSDRYVVAGVRHSLPAICAQIAETVGTRPPRPLPGWAARSLVTVPELTDRLRRRPPASTRRGVRALIEADRRRISSARAEDELGVTFRPLRETFAAEAEWYRHHALLP